MKITRKLAVAGAAVAAVCAAAPIAAQADSTAAPQAVHHAAFFGCFPHNGSGAATEVAGHPLTCPAGSILAEGDKGTQGPAGPAGAPGKDGAPGTSGVVSVTTVTGTAALPAIGGSWTAGHAAVKAFTLPAGTYLVTLTGDFYKTAATTATPVLQVQLNGAGRQLTGYTGAFPYSAAEATGTGSDGTPNGLEQTAVAEGIVTVAAGASLEADAFGYNPDRSGSGSGDFGVNVTVSAVQLQAAS